MGENQLAPLPTALYGVVLFAAGVAYVILQSAVIRRQGANSRLKEPIGNDLKGKASAVLYLVGIIFAFVHTISQVLGNRGILYVCVAALWLIPDRRIESKLAEE